MIVKRSKSFVDYSRNFRWLVISRSLFQQELLLDLVNHIPITYEMVIPQCKIVSCGDIIYRSTLDPVLRMEQQPIAKLEGTSLIAIILLYLIQKPGVLQGFLDTYIVAPLNRIKEHAFTKTDFRVGRRLATGGFGEVYSAELLQEQNKSRVILKRAKGFGEAEVWMNERCMRACPSSVASFITAFDETGKVGDPLWICWLYEGDSTLWNAIQKRNFPFNIEKKIIPEYYPHNKSKDVHRKLKLYSELMRQILENLSAIHDAGIVHRDVKPQNMILSDLDGRVKMIDLGAAADLRIGINYEPNEYLLDPRYAPPQQFIMNTSTPRAPPSPLAALLSPILWQLNKPDRFDMYSAGIVLLQMVFSSLRNDSSLFAFNKKFASLKYDLDAWKNSDEVRARCTIDPTFREGFELLSLNNDAGWDLLCQLLKLEPGERISANEALAHPFCYKPSRRNSLRVTNLTIQKLNEAKKVILNMTLLDWLTKKLDKQYQLTETIIEDEFAKDSPNINNRSKGSATLAYWKERQAVFEQKLQFRKNKQ